MKTLDQILDDIISVEGGYSNDPTDKGGETIWGITKFTATAFGYTGDMKSMSKDQAKDIYKRQYWIQPKFDKVNEINPDIAIELLDTGINMGVSTASKFLQRSLNVLNQTGTLYPDMVVDGSIGNMSLTALKAFIDKRGSQGVSVLLKLLNALQAVRYIEIAEGNQTQEKYEFGWVLNRVGV